MRITTGQTAAQYIKNLTNSQSKMNNLMNSILTGRKFNRASDNSISAVKAMKVRKQMANLDMYDTNLKTCTDIFYNAEKQLYDINLLSINAQEVINSANNSDDISNFQIYAEQLDGWAQEMLYDMNADFAERQLFGGTSNQHTPFTIQRVEIQTTADITSTEEFASLGNIPSAVDYTFADKFTTKSDFTAFADINTPADFVSDGTFTAVKDFTFAADFTTTEDFTAQGDIKDTLGTVIFASGDKVPTGTLLAAGTVIAAGSTIPKGATVPTGTTLFAAGDTVPKGTVFEAGTLLAAGSAIPEGATVPVGTFIPAGTVIFPGSSGTGKEYVCYNGLPVNLDASKLGSSFGNGEYTVVYDGNVANPKTLNINFETARNSGDNSDMYPGNNPIYVDIGIGIKYDGNYEVDPQTALDVSLNGASCTGCGVDEQGDSKNIIQILFDAKQALLDGDINNVGKYLDKISDANSIILGNITSLGTKQKSNDYYVQKNDIARNSLEEKQNDLETYDVVETGGLYADYQVAESAYNAALKLGSSTLPKSIFDFI